MPEMPEVETTKRGITPHIVGQRVTQVVVRNAAMRRPVPVAQLQSDLTGQVIEAVRRRGKYLLLDTKAGSAIIHLGMSGSLRVVDSASPAEKHDHVDVVFGNGKVLRLRDPRRFGLFLWAQGDPLDDPWLARLGPEPLEAGFDATYLHRCAAKRRVAIKQFIMDSHVVVGVGNIYASESLFRAGIHPECKAGSVSLARYQRLVEAIRAVLEAAIEQGGTTLRDFTNASGKPGYFAQSLNVYGRTGQPCPECSRLIRQIKQAQRATYYCGYCQR